MSVNYINLLPKVRPARIAGQPFEATLRLNASEKGGILRRAWNAKVERDTKGSVRFRLRDTSIPFFQPTFEAIYSGDLLYIVPASGPVLRIGGSETVHPPDFAKFASGTEEFDGVKCLVADLNGTRLWFDPQLAFIRRQRHADYDWQLLEVKRIDVPEIEIPRA